MFLGEKMIHIAFAKLKPKSFFSEALKLAQFGLDPNVGLPVRNIEPRMWLMLPEFEVVLWSSCSKGHKATLIWMPLAMRHKVTHVGGGGPIVVEMAIFQMWTLGTRLCVTHRSSECPTCGRLKAL